MGKKLTMQKHEKHVHSNSWSKFPRQANRKREIAKTHYSKSDLFLAICRPQAEIIYGRCWKGVFTSCLLSLRALLTQMNTLIQFCSRQVITWPVIGSVRKSNRTISADDTGGCFHLYVEFYCFNTFLKYVS